MTPMAMQNSVQTRKWWVLGLVCFSLFIFLLNVTVVNGALSSIQRDLHASFSGDPMGH